PGESGAVAGCPSLRVVVESCTGTPRSRCQRTTQPILRPGRGCGEKAGAGTWPPRSAPTIRVGEDIRADPRRTLDPGEPPVTSASEITELTTARHPRLDGPGHARGRHRSGARGGGRPELREWTSWHGDEPGPARVHPLPAGDATRPRRPEVGRTRPVRPVLRTLLAHAVHPAV